MKTLKYILLSSILGCSTGFFIAWLASHEWFRVLCTVIVVTPITFLFIVWFVKRFIK